MYLHRYEIVYKNDVEGDPTILVLRTYRITRETAMMYFIEPYGKERKVLKEARNKFAYTDKRDALEHFKRRTARRIRWYKYWQRNCEVALILADRIGDQNQVMDEHDELYDKP